MKAKNAVFVSVYVTTKPELHCVVSQKNTLYGSKLSIYHLYQKQLEL